MSKNPPRPTPKLIPVMVTTEHRGVFFGYVAPRDFVGVTDLRIERARMCVYWSAEVGGVLGLAAKGPTNGCRIGPQVPGITLSKITSVTEVSEAGAKAWETAPWSR